MAALTMERPAVCRPTWADKIPAEEWDAFAPVIEEAQSRGIPLALGGGLVFSAYSARWRFTKDIDLFILPRDRDEMIDITKRAGFVDYYDELPYDREWIYRGIRDGLILDLIWEMANHYREVDEEWLGRGGDAIIHGTRMRLLGLEELIWAKLFVVQRDRCDWPDLLNVLNSQVDQVDWDHLLERVGPEAPLLGGLLSAFRWLCPERSTHVPAYVWRRVGLAPEHCVAGRDGERAPLIDTRDWFGPTDEDTPC